MLPFILAFTAAGTVGQTAMEAQFLSGKMLCSQPDIVGKTCSSIERIDVAPDGVLTDTEETLLSPNRPVSLELTSPAHFADGAVCGTIEPANVEKAVVRVSGQVLLASLSASLLDKVITGLKPMAGMKACASLSLEDGTLFKLSKVEEAHLSVSHPARWIGPEEGYRVAPASNPAH